MWRILFLFLLGALPLSAAGVHKGVGNPVGLIVWNSAPAAVWGLTQVGGSVPASGLLNGSNAVGPFAAGFYNAQLFWHDGSSFRTDFRNGSVISALTVGQTPTITLALNTGDALDPLRSVSGRRYRSVTVTESYSTAPIYDLADRYGAATIFTDTQAVVGGAETGVRASVSMVPGAAGLLTIPLTGASGTTGSVLAVHPAETLVVPTPAAGTPILDRFYVNVAGLRFSTTDATIYPAPSVVAAIPNGIGFFDPLTEFIDVTVSDLYPVNWTWLAISTPAGTKFLFLSGLQANVGEIPMTNAAPAGDPSAATSNSSAAARTLNFRISLEWLRQQLDPGQPLPDGVYTVRVFTRTPNSIAAGGGWGNDQLLFAGNTSFEVVGTMIVNALIITP